jgi:hypothetical protein
MRVLAVQVCARRTKHQEEGDVDLPCGDA